MASSQKQTTLFVDFYIDPAKIEDFKTAHRPVWAACGREPELLLFDVFQDPSEPGHFRFIEIWNASREWFETKQMTKPYYDELWKGSKATWLKDPILTFFEREGEGCSYRKAYLQDGKCMD